MYAKKSNVLSAVLHDKFIYYFYLLSWLVKKILSKLFVFIFCFYERRIVVAFTTHYLKSIMQTFLFKRITWHYFSIASLTDWHYFSCFENLNCDFVDIKKLCLLLLGGVALLPQKKYLCMYDLLIVAKSRCRKKNLTIVSCRLFLFLFSFHKKEHVWCTIPIIIINKSSESVENY